MSPAVDSRYYYFYSLVVKIFKLTFTLKRQGSARAHRRTHRRRSRAGGGYTAGEGHPII